MKPADKNKPLHTLDGLFYAKSHSLTFLFTRRRSIDFDQVGVPVWNGWHSAHIFDLRIFLDFGSYLN